jgi:hypothetical protein
MTRKMLVAAMSLLIAGVALGADRRHHGTPHVGVAQKPVVKRPAAFGGTETVSSISSLGFSPFDSSQPYTTDLNSYFKYFTAVPGDFGGAITLPAGAVIDYVGLGSCDATGGNIEIDAYLTSADGVNFQTIIEMASSAHGMATPCTVDYNANALGFQVGQNNGQSIQLDAYVHDTAPTDGSLQFGSVEIWWHTVVSPAPAMPSFNDVPTDDFGFQYIEALYASGITGGCGGGNYCPDSPVNRRQMAIFLAKALGLYWPN